MRGPQIRSVARGTYHLPWSSNYRPYFHGPLGSGVYISSVEHRTLSESWSWSFGVPAESSREGPAAE